MSTNAVELISSGKGLPEVIKAISTAPAPLHRSDRPVKIPTKVTLSADQIKAVRKFARVVEAGVAPETRRMLADHEIAALVEERKMLDEIEKVIKARKEAQRIAVFNHYDVELEERDAAAAASTEVTDDGWYITKTSVATPGSTEGFNRVVVEGSPSLTAENLKAVIDGETFTEADYEACVAKVDVIDELCTLLLMRSKPSVVGAIQKAITTGRKTVQHRFGKVSK